MEREIKFRGYCKELKKWVFGQLLKDYSSGEYTILENEMEWIDGHEWRGEVPCNIQQDTIGQYTGSKDKNGVEIYEGDIVDWLVLSACVRYVTIRTEVRYEHGCFCPLNEAETDMENVTVIGNMYENKELLEDG